MLATADHHIARLVRVETILAFLRRTWTLEHPLAEGLSELELEVSSAINEARYLGTMLDCALADLRESGQVDEEESEFATDLEAPRVGTKEGGR